VRSRNGNCPFILTSLALVCTLSYGADNYYIGYRLTAKNIQPINEVFTVSKAMQPCSSHRTSMFQLRRYKDESVKELLEREQSRFIEYAAGEELHIKNNDSITATSIRSLETLTLPTKCYAVEFNGDFVTITLLE